MSIDKTKFEFPNKRQIPDEQIKVESIFSPSDAKQILWVDAMGEVDTLDTSHSTELSIGGQVMFSVLYLDNDNKIQKYETTVPFLNKLVDENIGQDTSVKISGITTLSQNYLADTNKLEAVIAINGAMYNHNDIEFMCGGDENICVKTEDLSCQELLKDDTVNLTENIQYPITDKMNNILSISSVFVVKSVIPDQNLFTVTGEIHTRIKYLTITDDVERITTTNFSEPFKREIEANGLTENGCIELFARVNNQNYKYEIDKETNKINIDVPLVISYRAYDKTLIPTVIDMFSLTNNVEISTQSYNKTTIFAPEYFESKIEGSTTIDANAPRIDKIIGFSNANLNISNTYTDDGKVYIEGVITFNLVYLNDELGNVESTTQEIPFKVSVELDGQNVFELSADGVLTDVEIVARRGREIFIDAKLKTTIYLSKNETDALITSVTNGEELPAKTSAIEIYFGKAGDDLWDIAKELRTKPEQITMQNPDVVLPLEQNENIVVYNSRQ